MADEPEPEVVYAAGVIARSPFGRVLMVRRTDDWLWSWPGGHLKNGETAEQCAFREFFEECSYRLGRIKLFTRRVKDDGDGLVDVGPFDSGGATISRLNRTAIGRQAQ